MNAQSQIANMIKIQTFEIEHLVEDSQGMTIEIKGVLTNNNKR
ncbi:hypothetical protein SAMN05421755_105121 [Nitrosomonas sp. Nm33]|nr:hypothetical protein SAMN05421755_105121 [Nitrosomonas sp. Nm33]